jgi:hypothetical protein
VAEMDFLRRMLESGACGEELTEAELDDVVAQLPGRTHQSVRDRLALLRGSMRVGNPRKGAWSVGELEILRRLLESSPCGRKLTTSELDDVMARLPGRSRRCVLTQLVDLRRKLGREGPGVTPWSMAEMEILKQPLESRPCGSKLTAAELDDVLARLPGRSRQCVRRKLALLDAQSVEREPEEAVVVWGRAGCHASAVGE